MTDQLRDYQRSIANEIKAEDEGAVFLDPGFGKTLTFLIALSEMKEEGRRFRAYIFAPIRVVETVWAEEAKKWGIDNLEFVKVRGQPAERLAKIRKNVDVYLINFEMMQWFYNQKPKDYGRKRPGEELFLIVDESTFLKNPQTQRWRSIRGKLGLYSKRFILTGTPIPNTYLNLWSQMGVVDQGKRLERAFTRYRTKYFEPDYMGFKWNLRRNADVAIREKIKDVVHRVDLPYKLNPDPLEINRDIQLTARELAKYRELERTAVAQLLEEIEESEITAFSAAALHMKLSQVANGFAYQRDPETDEQQVFDFHDKKLEVIQEIVESLGGKPVLIVYKFVHEIARVRSIYGEDVVVLNEGDTNKTIDAWNKKEIRILMMHPRSGGHGLNLQYGGSHIIMISPMYSGEDYDQVIKRLARPGQEEVVVVEKLRALDTVDMVIDNNLGERLDTQKAFLNYYAKLRERQ